MAYESTLHDPGPTPSVGVANDNLGAAGRAQLFKELDPTPGSPVGIGTDANPKRVRLRQRGASPYESGLVAVTDAYVSMTAAVTYPEKGFISNLTNAAQWIQIANTAEAAHTGQLPLAPHETRPWPITNAMTGIKVRASANGAVVCGVWGEQ